MPYHVELPPLLPDRLEATAEWIANNISPVAALVEPPEGAALQQRPFEVLDHQVEALTRLWQARSEGQTRALGHLASGGGKTTLAVIDFKKYLEESTLLDPPMQPRGLYVSHKHEINEQAAARFLALMPELEIAFIDSKDTRELPEVDMAFTTIQFLSSKLHWFRPDDYEYIFWDEAHHLEAPTWKRVLRYFSPLFEMAGTATVERMDGLDIREHFGEAVFSKDMADGIAENWLADVEYNIVFDKAVKRELADGFSPKSLTEIRELFRKQAEPDVLAKSIQEEIENLGLKDPKTIVFCESIAEAEVMAGLLDGQAYHSQTQDRKQVLQDYRNGTNKTIVTVDMFNEGVDVPDAEVIVFLRATQSGPLFEQQLGRGLRRSGRKGKAYIFDFVANIERVIKVRELGLEVQKRARKLGDPEASEIPGGRSRGGGLTIHTRHSDFEFDKTAVDILERWRALSVTEAPDDWMSVAGFVRAYGVTRETVYKVIGKKSEDLPVYLFGDRRAPALSPEDIELLLSHDTIGVEDAPDDWRSIHGFCAENNIHPDTVESVIGRNALDRMRRYKFQTRVSVGLSPTTQKWLLRNPRIQKIKNTPPAPPDWKSISTFLKGYRINADRGRAIITAHLEETGEKLPEHKYLNNVAPSLSPEVQATLANLPQLRGKEKRPLLPLPETFMSLNTYAEDRGVHRALVKSVMSRLGIAQTKYIVATGKVKTGQKRSDYGLSPTEQAMLDAHPDIQAEPAPDGVVSVTAFAKKLGTTQERLSKSFETWGVTTKDYRFGAVVGRGLSPEAQEVIKANFKPAK